jgi:tRNA(Ile)-lysidine synthase
MLFLEKIKSYITKHALINHSDSIIIGLSGGPDSMFLLHMLGALKEQYNLTLIAAHLNHEWRTEADAEEELCRTIAAQSQIPFVSAKLSSLSLTKKPNGSKEEYARAMRRHFLQQVMREHNANSIALGHHAQDQQETFFIRLIRGTSLAGLTGMYPRHGFYIRPLLETNKLEIMQWLNTNNISYATDASNESDNYLRNRVRKNVIPALVECDERWNNNFLTTISRLKQDDALLNDIAQSTLNTLLVKKDNKDVFDIKQFLVTHSSLHHRIIILWLILNNVQFPVTQSFLDEIIRFLSHDRGGKHAIKQEWVLVKKQGLAWIEKKD